MSLKIEQRLLDIEFTEFVPRIFATGVYLVPVKIKVGKTEKWVWVAEEFSDDTYYDGKLISPILISDEKESLITKEDDG